MSAKVTTGPGRMSPAKVARAGARSTDAFVEDSGSFVGLMPQHHARGQTTGGHARPDPPVCVSLEYVPPPPKTAALQPSVAT